VAGRDGAFLCLSMADGKILWQAGGVGACHGYNASPLVWDDLIIVPGYKYEQWRYSILGALKKDTGQKVWIYGTTPGGEGAHYGNVSPTRMKLDGKDQIVYSTGAVVCGLDARTGQPFWEHPIEKGWGANYTPCGPVVASPFLYVTTSDSKPPIGLQFDQGKPKEVWRGFSGNKGKYFPSLSQGMAVGGYVYSFVNEPAGPDAWYFGGGYVGYLVCVDPKTGQVKWEEKTGNGSMVEVDDHLLCLTYAGNLFLLNPSPDGFKKVTEWNGAVAPHTWMFQGKAHRKEPAPFWVYPVVARSKLYIRYDDTLSCFDLTAAAR
jgi:outer membrane protein assembly factor BamB